MRFFPHNPVTHHSSLKLGDPLMTFNLSETDFDKFIRALRYAAYQHRNQRRKGGSQAPYINHPIGVTDTLWRAGGGRDIDTLVAALLHDTIEDTGATPQEIRDQFGPDVLSLV